MCECPVGFEECEFTMDVHELKSFISYQILLDNEGKQVRGFDGTIYNLDNVTGEAVPVRANRTCSNFMDRSKANCTEPNWVDGTNYKVTIAINGVIPSPTLIVDENAIIIVHVNNKLKAEPTSIHWHGIEQHKTPWMDGVGQVTQCAIQASSSFTYAFAATQPGTFWYHSHTGTQRAEGLFGALVIRENSATVSRVLAGLEISSFEDFPDRHTVVISDWFRAAGIDDFTQLNIGLGFYPSEPIDEVPLRGDERYTPSLTYDLSEVGPKPFFSALINGLGREASVPYIQSRMSVFRVIKGNIYRFRLIGTQALYAFRFSIDGHSLTTIATDSYFIKPIEQVTYIILHSGERYDFLLNADADGTDYIMRIETLEVEMENCTKNAPFRSRDHLAEAILHYETLPGQETPIPSTMYESISQSSPRRDCTTGPRCKAVNCPFKDFHFSYGIDCINVDAFQLLLETPEDQLPMAEPTNDHLFFFNLNFEGDSTTSSINGINFILPPFPPLVQDDQFANSARICNRELNCSVAKPGCVCTHSIQIEYNQTVQFVISALGQFDNAHPVHLHGHTFHVVRIGYPSYYDNNNAINKHNSDIVCDDPTITDYNEDGMRQCQKTRSKCTSPEWRDNTPPPLSINATTPRKDTVIVPAGGYIVINFISDNPGIWFMHCHIEPHQLEGMVLFIEEAKEEQKSPPDSMKMCRNYEFNSVEFYKNLLSSDAITTSVSIFTQLVAMLVILLFT